MSKQLGVTVTYVVPPTPTYDPSVEVSTIDSLVAQGYNAFAVFPDGESAIKPTYQRLISRGIPVFDLAGCTTDPTPALLCYATNVKASATYETQVLEQAMGGHGNIAFLTGLLTDANTALREQGVNQAIAASGGKVKLAQLVSNIDSPSSAPPAVESLLASKGSSLNGMLSTDYYPSVAAASILSSDPQFRHVLFIGQDNSPEVMNAVEKRDIYGTMFQNDYGQAQVAITWLYDMLSKGCTVNPNGPFTPIPGPTSHFVNSGYMFVSQSAVGQYIGRAGEHPLLHGPGTRRDFQVPVLPVVKGPERRRGSCVTRFAGFGSNRVRAVALVADQGPAVGLIVLIILTWTVFGVINGSFVSSFNLFGIGQLAARDAVLGMAQAALVVMGRMNLAVGSVGAICVSLLGYMLVSANIALPLTLLVAAVPAGVTASVIMGVVELRSGLSSFIVTLAFASAYGGGALLVSRSANFQITNSALNALGSGTFLSAAICPLVVVALICGVVTWVIYNRTSFGWKSLAIGANERAARASGVNAGAVLLGAYALSGLLAALAAVMESSYELSVNANVGSDWLLPSFVAVVLGGVTLTGGDITIGGILLAAVFFDSLQSGLTILNVSSYWLNLAEGLVLLVAVIIDQLRRNRRGRLRRDRPVVAVEVTRV